MKTKDISGNDDNLDKINVQLEHTRKLLEEMHAELAAMQAEFEEEGKALEEEHRKLNTEAT